MPRAVQEVAVAPSVPPSLPRSPVTRSHCVPQRPEDDARVARFPFLSSNELTAFLR